MFKSLLVPLDGSSFGEQALPLALSVARRAGAGIQLVHVVVPEVYAEGVAALSGVLHDRARQEAQSYLDGLMQRLAAATQVPLTPVVLTGTIAEAIQDRASRSAASLVVLTTHGRGPLSRFWIGSVADELLRRLHMPVLLVRPQERPVPLDSEPAIRRILIPLDGSPAAEQILAAAGALAGLLESECLLLRVVPAGGSPQAQEPAPQHLDQANQYLAQIAERLRGQGLTVKVQVEAGGQAATAILESARNQQADLIALETRGHRGLARLFLGSVADKVVRGASTPVLVQCPSGS